MVTQVQSREKRNEVENKQEEIAGKVDKAPGRCQKEALLKGRSGVVFWGLISSLGRLLCK